MKNNCVYIYNLQQAYFYIRNGLNPVCPPNINNKSKMVYFVFDKKESNPIYTEWLVKSKKS